MKLATLKDGTRDGRLVIVSRDLARCVAVPEIARTLQAVLDDWDATYPALDALSAELNAHRLADAEAFDPRAAMAPLPRAYQWADGSAYVNHVELVRRARGATMPPEFWTDPLMYQGGSDSLLGACDDIVLADEDWGIDFEAEVAVVTDDVPMGVTPAAAAGARPAADAGQRRQPAQPDPGRARQGLRLPAVASRRARSRRSRRPRTSWATRGATASCTCRSSSTLNGAVFGRPDAGVDMTFGFPQLIAHLARTRELEAGSIVGSGTVSNREAGGPGRPAAQGGVGYSCIAEQRTRGDAARRQAGHAVHALRRPRCASRCTTPAATRSSAPSIRSSFRRAEPRPRRLDAAGSRLPAAAAAPARRHCAAFRRRRRAFAPRSAGFVATVLRLSSRPPRICSRRDRRRRPCGPMGR